MIRRRMNGLVALVVCAGTTLSATGLVMAQPSSEPAAASAKERAAPAADQLIPVRKITLYRSGVGYFERSGEVVDSAELQLRFKTEQINDILKSMVLLDLSGGKIESVSYGSKEPLEKRLASFGINISANPSVPELLGQLRGAPLKVTVAGDAISGTVFGIEQRVSPGNKETGPVTTPYVNLVTSTGMRSIAIADISTFEILDAELAGELNKALGALAEYRADRSKAVDLRFAGQGQRRVVVAYVHEMPVWKTSYRLVLPDVDAAEGKGKLMLQGWAIVENTTDQDWNRVQLGLVSGRPVSFQMDLYEPLFSARPWIPVPTIPGVSPRVFALGIDADQLAAGEEMGRSLEAMRRNDMQSQRTSSIMSGRMARGAAPAAAPAPMDKAGGYAQQSYAGITGSQMADYSAGAQATGASVGEVFQFQVDAPVSLERQKSAMIPILTTQVSGRRVSIFNAGDGSQFPMRGVEITNDSGQALLPGPLSVFDVAAYAGDAQIGQIPKADKRFLAYALDLDVAVLTTPTSSSTITKLRIADGMIVQSIKDRMATTYEFANKDAARARTLVLEHPKTPGYELVETEKPSELTQDLYRFTIPIESSKAKKFTVTQERTRSESVGVTSFSMESLLTFRRDGKLSDGVLKAIQTASDKQSAINATEREITKVSGRISEIAEDQTRIRNNMNAVDRNSQLYSKYVSRLTAQETELDQARENRDQLNKQLETQRNELAQYIKGLNVE
jgi:hypothetical protein